VLLINEADTVFSHSSLAVLNKKTRKSQGAKNAPQMAFIYKRQNL